MSRVTVDSGPGLTVHVGALIVIIAIACLLAFVNRSLNTIPTLQRVLYVVIVVVALLLVLASLGLIPSPGLTVGW